MKHILKTIIMLLITFTTILVKAQNNSFDFKLTSSSVNFDGQDISLTTTIIKEGATVIWNQTNNGASSSSVFMVTSSSGDWNQNSSLGEINYEMTFEGRQAELSIIGEASGISATLTFSISSSEKEIYTIPINNISY